MNMGINIFVGLRLMVGILFVISGGEKLVNPYQNFLYVLQSYELVGPPLEEGIAHVIPWVEFFLGIFIFLGLWLNVVLRGLFILVFMFLFTVAQAVVRRLPLVECGCFGGLVSFPLPVTFMLDAALLILTRILIKKIKQTSRLSLDGYWE